MRRSMSICARTDKSVRESRCIRRGIVEWSEGWCGLVYSNARIVCTSMRDVRVTYMKGSVSTDTCT